MLYGKDKAGAMSIGQILLLPKPLLEKRVLSDERIEIYECGRDDIRSGQIDRRVLATLEYLAESGLRPSVTSLKCGHGFLTSSGNVSEHSSGNAVDIATVNGIPILGHQEPGGITEQTVRRLMQLQGTMAPHQIISLLEMGGATFAMADHNDHIHVGFQPMFGANRKLGKQALAVLAPEPVDGPDRRACARSRTRSCRPSRRSTHCPPRASARARPTRASRTTASPGDREGPFGFVQLEFGFLLGPPDGRYIVRPTADALVESVLVLSTLGAPQRARLGARRARAVTTADPEAVPTSRATIVAASPLSSPAAWLAELDRDAEVDSAVAVLNHALRAHRAATADPYVAEVSRDRALVVRLGYGSGDEVADGRYGEAIELPRRGPSRETLDGGAGGAFRRPARRPRGDPPGRGARVESAGRFERWAAG